MMGATGATTPGGGRREGADGAVMEALRERIKRLRVAAFKDACSFTDGLELREVEADPLCPVCQAIERAVAAALHPEPEARPPEAARPPEPGEAPSGAPTGVELREALREARGELEVCEMANDEAQDENVRLRELLEDARDCRDPLDPCRDCLKCLHADYEHAIHRLEESQAQIAELRARLATPERSEAAE